MSDERGKMDIVAELNEEARAVDDLMSVEAVKAEVPTFAIMRGFHEVGRSESVEVVRAFLNGVREGSGDSLPRRENGSVIADLAQHVDAPADSAAR